MLDTRKNSLIFYQRRSKNLSLLTKRSQFIGATLLLPQRKRKILPLFTKKSQI